MVWEIVHNVNTKRRKQPGTSGRKDRKPLASFCCSPLLDVGVVVDMVLTVAVVALAFGAISEFQLWVTHVGSAADGAPMGVWSGRRCHRCLIGTGVGEGDDLRLLGTSLEFLPKSAEIHDPGNGYHIHNVFSKEQEIVGKRDDGEQVSRPERHFKQAEQDHDQVQQGKNPRFHRDNKEKQEGGLGIHGGIAEEQTQIQVADRSVAVEDHGVYVHEHDTGQVEEVKFQRSPLVFHGPSQRVVAQQQNKLEQNVAACHGQRIGNQPPDLTVKNGAAVKAEQIIQNIVV